MANRNKRDESFIKHVNEIITANMKDDKFGVSELASEMNMSRTTLHRKIKPLTGQSVSQLLRNVRLNKALEILKNESLSVAEAAYMSGFGSATYFSKCFHDYFGFPPVEVTKQAFDVSDLPEPKTGITPYESGNQMHNFPIQTTSFIGRAKEMEIIADLIEKNRLVTLTGTGGCGKTRLACEVVAHLTMDFPDGIWFVDLAPVETVDLVAKQLMHTLGLSETPGGDIMKTVEESIRDNKMLILIDNCEHLLITCAEIARRLIESVPGLSLFVTSREALNIKGERVWIVPSLSLVDPASIIDIKQAESSEAVRLFADRANLNNPGFELVMENASSVLSICHHVDGMPLAIELVASRTRHMDTMTILDHLSERFDRLPSLDQGIIDRHKTIEDAIDWSYNLLPDDERTLFRRLSVFSGGFDLNAAVEVCTDNSIKGDRILDLLSHLVEKSMIQTIYLPGQRMRYKLLETLQRFAANLLAEKGEAEEARIKHLEYYTRMAENAYEEQFEAQSKWVEWLEKERSNLLSALNWSESNSSDNFTELAGYLGWYWRLKSELLLGINYLEIALAKNTNIPKHNARALLGMGLLTWMSGDGKVAVSYMRKSMDIWRNLDMPKEVAIVLSELSEPLLHSGEREASVKCSEEGFEIARGLGYPGLINHCLLYYSIVLVHTKQYEKGEPLVEKLLLSSQKLENIYGTESALHLHGDCAVGTKDFVEGEKRYAKGVDTSFKHGNLLYVAFDMQGVAFALSGQGRYAKAIRLDAAARVLFKELGVKVDGMVVFWDEWIETYIEGAKKEVGEMLTKQYEEEGSTMGTDTAVEYTLDFVKD